MLSAAFYLKMNRLGWAGLGWAGLGWAGLAPRPGRKFARYAVISMFGFGHAAVQLLNVFKCSDENPRIYLPLCAQCGKAVLWRALIITAGRPKSFSWARLDVLFFIRRADQEGSRHK